MSVADHLLGGGAVFSVDQDVEWHPSLAEILMLDFPGVWEAIYDSTPPVITAANIVAEATSPAGAAVAFSPTAADDVDGPAAVSCDAITATDWIITGPMTISVLAERSGIGSGRTYTATVQCSDASHNMSTATASVSVPHDKGK